MAALHTCDVCKVVLAGLLFDADLSCHKLLCCCKQNEPFPCLIQVAAELTLTSFSMTYDLTQKIHSALS